MFLWHHVPSSGHFPSYKIVFMYLTTFRWAVSRAQTWMAAACRWGILLSGISSNHRWHPAWQVETFAPNGKKIYWSHLVEISWSVRQGVFQAWHVQKNCQQSQWIRACRKSHHKLVHCEGLATFGNRKPCCIYCCMCRCMHQTLL